ncbi:MAG: DUF3368 domain-containing protein [Thiocapsa sp.]|uniref:DUF3368 domain-containing protein n=1 Tax=Thiocapsa sp. TaxID=2024551 RepID=UPI001BD02BD1|nr:DUF3368 domain-containing protein [Thiocapsa sp.]QVL50157.1 MAG: DUF3368 domain-containing protein [Thiocapsa sp.]
MPEQAVVNASPLILLSKARVIELLQQAALSILVPEMVALEVNRRGELDPTARAVATTSWISTVATPSVPRLIQSWDLGPGESGVSAYAQMRPGVIAINDDGAARRCADTLGIPLLGTLGF